MPPDEPNPEEQQEELPQDYQTPFSPPSDVDDTSKGDQTTYPSDPATDTGIQPEELYDEGPYGAGELPEPDMANDVTGYHPERKKNHPPIL
ncbi:MAG TPA: hypothetical protein VFT53_00020 [Candidatus Saccharimonadales bacterium]|nr:hypothetical protein [Candidatus Saccharimonadales bacterium]